MDVKNTPFIGRADWTGYRADDIEEVVGAEWAKGEEVALWGCWPVFCGGEVFGSDAADGVGWSGCGEVGEGGGDGKVVLVVDDVHFGVFLFDSLKFR